MQSSSKLILIIEAAIACLESDARLLYKKSVRGPAASNMRIALASIEDALSQLVRTPHHVAGKPSRPRDDATCEIGDLSGSNGES